MVKTAFDVLNIEYQYENDDDTDYWPYTMTVSVEHDENKHFSFTEDAIRAELESYISSQEGEPVKVVDLTAFYTGTKDPLRGNYEDFQAEQKKLHPGLYRYKGKIGMRKGWTECQECDDIVKLNDINFYYLKGYGQATVCDSCVGKYNYKKDRLSKGERHGELAILQFMEQDRKEAETFEANGCVGCQMQKPVSKEERAAIQKQVDKFNEQLALDPDDDFERYILLDLDDENLIEDAFFSRQTWKPLTEAFRKRWGKRSELMDKISLAQTGEKSDWSIYSFEKPFLFEYECDPKDTATAEDPEGYGLGFEFDMTKEEAIEKARQIHKETKGAITMFNNARKRSGGGSTRIHPKFWATPEMMEEQKEYYKREDMKWPTGEWIEPDKFNAQSFEARENKDGTIVLTDNEWNSCIHLYNGNYLWGDTELKLIDEGLKSGFKFEKVQTHSYDALKMIHLYERLLRKRNVRSYPNPNKTFEAREKKIGSITIVKNPNFPSGTSLQAYIKTNRAELRKVFGNPNMGESGDGKSKGKEWNLIVGNHRVTIYDKREKDKKGTKYFNIGGNRKYAALLVAQALSIHRNERVYAKEIVPQWLEDKRQYQQVKSIDEHPDLTYERAKEYEDNRRGYGAETFDADVKMDDRAWVAYYEYDFMNVRPENPENITGDSKMVSFRDYRKELYGVYLTTHEAKKAFNLLKGSLLGHGDWKDGQYQQVINGYKQIFGGKKTIPMQMKFEYVPIRRFGYDTAMHTKTKNAETFDVEFNEWAEQEMMSHGKDISFKDWAEDEGMKHGDVPITEWAQHEDESHDARYGAESFEDFKRKMVGDSAVAGDVGYMEALEEFYEDYLEDFERITDEFCPEPETFEEFKERVLKNDYENFGAEEGDDCPSCANACKHDDTNMIKVESIYDYEVQSPSNMVIQVTCLECGESGTFYADEVDWHGEEAKLRYSPQIAVNMMNPVYGDLKCSRCHERFQMAAENWGGDPKGKLATALRKAREKAKKPQKPLKIEKLDAENERPQEMSYFFVYVPSETGKYGREGEKYDVHYFRTLEEAQKAFGDSYEIYEYRALEDVPPEEREKQKQDNQEWYDRSKKGEFFEDFWWKNEMSRYGNSDAGRLHHSTYDSSVENDERDGFYEKTILPSEPSRREQETNRYLADDLGISETLAELLNASRTFGMYISQRAHPDTVKKYRQRILDGFDAYGPESKKEQKIVKMVRQNMATRGVKGPSPSYVGTNRGILRKPELHYVYDDYYDNPIPFMGYELTDEEKKIIGKVKDAETSGQWEIGEQLEEAQMNAEGSGRIDHEGGRMVAIDEVIVVDYTWRTDPDDANVDEWRVHDEVEEKVESEMHIGDSSYGTFYTYDNENNESVEVSYSWDKSIEDGGEEIIKSWAETDESLHAEGKKRKKLSGQLSDPFDELSLDSGDWKGIVAGFGVGLLALFGYSKLRK